MEEEKEEEVDRQLENHQKRAEDKSRHYIDIELVVIFYLLMIFPAPAPLVFKHTSITEPLSA